MATLSKPVGYECEFVDQVPEDYFCKQCKHVAREPNITTCCGECFCKACIDVVIQNKKPCPSCESNELQATVKNEYQAKILALNVHCKMKDRGCEWTGQFQHLDAHLETCPKIEIKCDFSYAGCQAEFLRDNQEKHMEQNTQRHLAMMAAATKELTSEFKYQLNQKDTKIQLLDRELLALGKDLEQQYNELSPIFNKSRTHTSVPPYDVVLSNYRWKRIQKGLIISKDVETHPGGYKFSFWMWPNGTKSGEGSHVSLEVHLQKGNFDAHLKFPVKFTLALELLSSYKHKENYTKILECEIPERKNNDRIVIGSDYTFITDRELEEGYFIRNRSSWDWQGPDQDRLMLRVVKIVIHKP